MRFQHGTRRSDGECGGDFPRQIGISRKLFFIAVAGLTCVPREDPPDRPCSEAPTKLDSLWHDIDSFFIVSCFGICVWAL